MMDGAGFSVVVFVALVVALAALAVAVMFSRRYAKKIGRSGREDNGHMAELVSEIRRSNDLAEKRLLEIEDRLRRLETRHSDMEEDT